MRRLSLQVICGNSLTAQGQDTQRRPRMSPLAPLAQGGTGWHVPEPEAKGVVNLRHCSMTIKRSDPILATKISEKTNHSRIQARNGTVQLAFVIFLKLYTAAWLKCPVKRCVSA